MTNNGDSINPLFLQLVLSLQSAAMYQMGKTISPLSGKIERDLEQARISIDLLLMLQQKTEGNLKEEEKRILDGTVYNLQMNFVDELNRDPKEGNSGDKEAGSGGEGESPGEKEPENSDNNL